MKGSPALRGSPRHVGSRSNRSTPAGGSSRRHENDLVNDMEELDLGKAADSSTPSTGSKPDSAAETKSQQVRLVLSTGANGRMYYHNTIIL